jgi:hypothetical protein
MPVVTVDFPPRGHPPPVSTVSRRGKCGIHTGPEPYSGPPVIVISGEKVANGKHRTFHVARIEKSPTGSCHGSFRINEITKKGELITHGYHCSYPDFDICLRVARGSHYSSLQFKESDDGSPEEV